VSRAAETIYDVRGMTCASCAKRVERALGRVEGVREATVDLVRERARVLGSARESELAAAVKKAGYELVPRAAEPTATPLPVDLRTGAAIAIAVALLAIDLTLPALSGWTTLAIAAATTFGIGAPIFARAFRLLRARDVSMETLVALGSTAALVLGALSLLHGSHGSHGHSDASTAAIVIAIVLAGRSADASAKRRAARTLDAMTAAEAGSVRATRHGETSEIRITELREGDVAHVAPFALVPADGSLESERAYFDESALTGESVSVAKTRGDTVLGGTLNGPSPVVLRITALGASSVRGRLEAETASALARPPREAMLADRASRWIVPLALLTSTAAFGVHLALGATPLAALRPAIDVLVIACPCALGLATPAALVAAVARGAREGIVIRDAARFLDLARVRRLFVDKTGTLTEGEARLQRVVMLTDTDETSLLRWVASVEAESEHPLGHALFASAMERGIAASPASDVRVLPGIGIEGRVEEHVIRVESVTGDAGRPAEVETLRREGCSLALARVDGVPIAVLAVRDRVRPTAASTVASLVADGVAIEMLSGDHVDAARVVGDEVRLARESVHGGLRPEDKVARVEAARRVEIVAMVGDGVNDAPALAAADVGIAIGTGAGAAVRAAAITLRDADIARIRAARHLARATWSTLRGNLAWAFAYNALAMPLAAVGALDRIGGAPAAAAAMAISSIAVLLWSLRLARVRL
jgi:Cu+-exporting ATPase